MPANDLYWNSVDFGSEEESIPDASLRNYVDPWDLENYAYIREHLDSEPVSSDEHTENSTSFCYMGLQREQSYAAIEEVKYDRRKIAKSDKKSQGIYDYGLYEFEENPYEVNTKDNSSPYGYCHHKDRLKPRPRPPTHATDSRERSLSFSYGDYGTGNEIYSKLEDYHRTRRESTVPFYDDLRSKPQPRNFGLSNYGHLKIDYSYNWNKLNKYICN